MEIASKLPGVELAQLQSLRQPQRSGQQAGGPQRAELPTPEETGVQVTISPAGRAAAEVVRTESPEQAGAVVAPGRAETPDPVTAAQQAAPEQNTVSSVATPVQGQPAAAPLRSAEAAARGAPAQPPAAESRPDASSAAGNQAVQLYLENSTRPAGQPAVAAIRASA